MNNLFKSYMLAATATLALCGCSNNLDEKVYSDVMEESYGYQPKDFASNIVGAYSSLRSTAQMSFWQLQELSGCCIVIAPNASGWNDGGIYLQQHFHTWNAELGAISDIWNSYFKGIMLCNAAIEKVENNLIPAPSEKERTIGLAELRTLRAYYYWLICDNFGDAPLVTSTAQEMPAKSSRKAIYDFIISELTAVVDDLDDNQDETTYARFNKWAGKCLLANIYINAEVYTGTPRWNECLQQCNDIINGGKCELSPRYKDSFRATGVESSKEVLMTIPYDYDKGVVGNWLYMNSWHKELKKKFLTNAEPNEAGGPRALGQFIDTYQAGDSRLNDTWLYGPQFDVDGNALVGRFDMAGQPLNFTKDLPDANYTNEMEGYRMFKYEVSQGSEWSSSTDIPIFRYAEVLLMKAECLLRTGQPGAGALITELRRRNFTEQPDAALVSDDQLKEDSSYPWGYMENYQIVDEGDQSPVKFGRLLDEYLWEYAYEGHTRRELIRFGVYTTKSWLSHKPNGNHRTVFPIPQSAITANPLIVQNPDYLTK